MRITVDRFLDIIQCFYLNKTLTEEEQEMIDELIEATSDYYKQLDVIQEYQKAIKTVIESEPQGEEDETMLLVNIKTYLQGILDGKW